MKTATRIFGHLRGVVVSALVMTIVLFPLHTANAQVSEGGIPYSFRNLVTSNIDVYETGAVDAETLLREDETAPKDEPFRFGYPFEVDLNLKNAGTWQDLPSGDRVWRLHIKTRDAYSINLIYDNFLIPKGSKFFVYNADRSQVLGAFTYRNNKPHGKFATAPTSGSECIVEYYEPAEARGEGQISISRIVHAYKNVFNQMEKDLEDFGDSGSCNNNVNCPEGDDWQDQKRSVAMILTSGGFRLCSGFLVNNVAEDLTPYFMTANHCLGGEETWIVMFNYESPDCDDQDGPTDQTVQGTTLLANNTASDFALLELSEEIPESYDVHFAGWNADPAAPTNTVGIHHPSGDIKKISFDNDPAIDGDWSGTPSGSHWEVVWDDGTTEGGSSGSPIFDQNHRVIGQLHGGTASCSNQSGYDVYGKFDLSWDYGSSASTRLMDWLDPNNSGTTVMDGRDMSSVSIAHDPLPETEDTTGPYTVIAQITTSQPPLANPQVVFGFSGSFTDSVAMTVTGNPDEYSADIPGGNNDVTITYYISATDASNEVVTHPASAPDMYHSFYVGADTEAPVVTHTPLRNQAIMRWPAAVSAGATDNIGISEVSFTYHINDGADAVVEMTDNDGDGVYTGTFTSTQAEVEIGDSVFYNITVTDASNAGNQTVLPETGMYGFEMIDALGVVLVVNDDEDVVVGNSARVMTDKGVQMRSQEDIARSATEIITHLITLGYVVDSTGISDYDAYDWNNYDVIVSSSGRNTSTLENDSYRAALVSYAQSGGKMLVEGGEIGWDWDDEDPDLAEHVLHIDDWDGDESGNILLRDQYTDHPFVTTPNVLSSSIAITYDGYGDQDAVTATDDAFSIYSTTENVAETGLLVYDDNPNPTGGQVVYFPFAWWKVTDQPTRFALLENAMHYLTVTEAEPAGSIAGVVDLSDASDDSGVEVEISGPGTQETTTTANDGSYSFTGLYNGTHIVTVSHTGYFPYSQTDTVEITGDPVTGVDFSFDPIAPGTVSGTISVTGADPEADSVVVQVLGTDISDTTGVDGTYSLAGIQPGPISIQAQKVGYLTTVVDTTMANGGSLTIDMTLQIDIAPPFGLSAVDGLDTRVELSWSEPVQGGDEITEGFEDGVFPPADWSHTSTSDTTWQLYDNPDYIYEGMYAAGTWWAYNHQSEWMVTPQFTVPGAGELTFWSFAYQGSTYGDHYYVKISTDGGTSWTTLLDLSELPVYDNPTFDDFNNYQEPYTIDLTDYAGQSVQIAWHAESAVDDGLWYIWFIDNVSVMTSEGVLTFDESEFTNINQGGLASEKTLQQTRELTKNSPIKGQPELATVWKNRDYSRGVMGPFGAVVRSVQSLEGYSVYRATAPDIDPMNETPIATMGTDVLSYDDTEVINGTTYYYVVTADYGPDGESPPSNEVSATPINYPPSVPTNFTATNEGTTVNFSWDANPEDDVIRYVIYQKVDQGEWMATDSTSNTTYQKTVEDNHVYQYKLIARDDEGAGSDFTETVVLPVGNIPPENLAALGGMDGHILLEWDAPGTQFTIPDSLLYDFEEGPGDFVAEGDFALGTPTDGPGGAYSGVNAWGTNLSGDYGNDVHSTVTSPEIDLNGYTAPVLRFYHWFDTEGYYDGGNVKISIDAGATWTILEPVGGYPEDAISSLNDFLEGEPGFSGHDIGEMWHQVEFDLSAYVDETVQIKFDFAGDGSINYPGWYIDDVVIADGATVMNLMAEGFRANQETSRQTAIRPGQSGKFTSLDALTSSFNEDQRERRGSTSRLLAVQELTGYKIYRSTSTITDTAAATLVASIGDTLMYDDWGDGGNGLQNGTMYYYVVVADYGTDGMSAPSTEATATPVNAPPLPPTELIVANSDVNVTLTWSASPSYDAAGYVIYAAQDDGDFVAIDSTSSTSYTYDVEDNHVYSYRVITYDNDGAESDQTETVFIAIGNIPPESLTAEGGMDGHVLLEWNAPGTQFMVPDSLLFDFEEGPQDFVAEGDFALGMPTSGPNSTHSGSNAWGTNLAEDYEGDVHSTLTSPEIDLSGYTSPVLKYFQWYDTESYYDGGNVKISIDGGASWSIIYPESGYPEDAVSTANDFLAGEPAFSGHDIGEMWHRATFNLAEFSGETVQIRFDFAGDGIIDYPGWFIDDVVVTEAAEFVNLSPRYGEMSRKEMLAMHTASGDAQHHALPGNSLSFEKGNKDIKSGLQGLSSNNAVASVESPQVLTGYKIYRSTSTITDTTTATLVASVGDTLMYDDWGDGGTGLQNGTMYYYVVVANYGPDGMSAASNEATATPVNYPPLAPTGLTVTNSDVNVTLDWTASTSYDAAGYYIYEKMDAGDFALIDSTSDLTYTYTVEDNHVYSYKVSTYDHDGAESNFSETVYVPIGNIPPENLAAESGLDGHVMLEWDEPGTQFTIPDSILFDFEEDNGGFTGAGEWAWGSPDFEDGPFEAYSGSNLWGVDLVDDYDNSSSYMLTSPEIDLTNFENPMLKYYQWYDIETGWDGGNVKISIDGGTTWELLTPMGGYPDESIASSGEPGFTGHDNMFWERITMSLGAYAGETVQLAFTFSSDGSVTYPGWYIDDVAVTEEVEMAGGLVASTPRVKTGSALDKGFGLLSAKKSSGIQNGFQTMSTGVGFDVDNRVYPKGHQASPMREILTLTGYKIYRSTSTITDTANATLVATVGDTLMYDDWGDGGAGLQNGTTYYYVIVADYGADGQSAASTEATAMPQNYPPLPPMNLMASNTGTDVTLTWEASTSYDVAGYIIYQQLEGGDWTMVDSTSDVSHTFSVENNHFYGFQVTAYDNDGAESDESNSVFVPIGNLPPETLEATSGYDGYVALEWEAPGTSFFGSDTLLYDFEEDNGEFTGDGEWGWGAPTYSEGPSEAYSGMNVWGINLSGEYSNSTLSSLTTPEIDLSDFDNPAFGFYQWYDIENSWDGGNVKISTDGGSSWQLLTPTTGYPDDNITGLDEPGFTGDNTAWSFVSFNLGDYADMTVQFRFDFGTDGSVTYPGWYIDDLNVFSNEEVYINGIAASELITPGTGFLTPAATKKASLKDGVKGAQVETGDANSILRDTQDLLGYKIYRSTSPGVEATEANLVASLGDTLMYDDWGANGEGLENGTTYYYVVAADYGTDGESSPSNEVAATPENHVPDAPTGLQATVDGMNVMLDWDDHTAYDMDHYRVYRAAGTSDDYAHIGDAETSDYMDTVPVDGAYRYRVMVMDEGGLMSEMSSPTSFMMVGNIPPIIAAESGIDDMVPVHVRPWSPGEEVELVYDDGSAEVIIGSGTVPIKFAVRMSPGGSGEVNTISMYWANSSGAAEQVIPTVWSSNTAEGVPDQIIWEGAAFTPDQEDYWMDLPVANLTFDGEFWVGVQYQTANGPFLGLDENGNAFLRSYVENPGDGSWVELGVAGQAGNLMIRTTVVVLADDGSERLVSMTPVETYNPVYRVTESSTENPWLNTGGSTPVSREFDPMATATREIPPLHNHIADFAEVMSTESLDYFEIWRRADYEEEFSLLATLGADTTLYEDWGVGSGTVYEYYAKSVYEPGGPENTSPPSDTVSAEPTGEPDAVAGENGLPTEYGLSQNFPNPFNPTTQINYQLPEPAQVKIDIYNMLGQQIRTLVNTHQDANYYTIEWDGTNDLGQTVGSGVYFYHIRAGKQFQETRKMILLR